MKFIVLAFLCFFALDQVSCKKFTRCQLAGELKRQGFPRNLLADWVCVIENESFCDTGRKGPKSKEGSCRWGLFQISDKNWCSSGKPGKDCNVRCEDLLTDDITHACNCAKKIYNKHKFSHWPSHAKKCVGKLPDLSPCKL